jgi:hypothetical protein
MINTVVGCDCTKEFATRGKFSSLKHEKVVYIGFSLSVFQLVGVY